MNSLRIKKGDLVKVVAGNNKGKVAKVVSTNAAEQTVTLENVGVVKRHVKPNQVNPRGGTREVHKALPISNVALVVDEAKGKTSRVGYKLDKEGKKVRVTKSNGKEVK
jgi:large subunit ribosomal protein L24